MQVHQAQEIITRVCSVASTLDIGGVTRATLVRIMENQSSETGVSTVLRGAQDMPWANKDLTNQAATLQALDALGRARIEKVEVGEVVSCFPAMPYGKGVEPIAVISLPILSSYFRKREETKRIGGWRRLFEKKINRGQSIPGLRKERDGFYLASDNMAAKFHLAFDLQSDQTVDARADLARIFLQNQHRVILLMPMSGGRPVVSQYAAERAEELESEGVKLLEVEAHSEIQWTRDLWLQLDRKIFVDNGAGAAVLQGITRKLNPDVEFQESPIGEGGRSRIIGETLVYCTADDGLPIITEREQGSFILSEFRDVAKHPRHRLAEGFERVGERMNRDYSGLGFRRAIPVSPFWFPFFSDAQRESVGLSYPVFIKSSHIDVAVLPVNKSRQVGIHPRFVGQNASGVEEMLRSSGFSWVSFPDRASYTANGVNLQRGGVDLIMDSTAGPEIALLDPRVRIATTAIPFGDNQPVCGSIHCAVNILWVPTGAGR